MLSLPVVLSVSHSITHSLTHHPPNTYSHILSNNAHRSFAFVLLLAPKQQQRAQVQTDCFVLEYPDCFAADECMVDVGPEGYPFCRMHSCAELRADCNEANGCEFNHVTGQCYPLYTDPPCEDFFSADTCPDSRCNYISSINLCHDGVVEDIPCDITITEQGCSGLPHCRYEGSTDGMWGLCVPDSAPRTCFLNAPTQEDCLDRGCYIFNLNPLEVCVPEAFYDYVMWGSGQPPGSSGYTSTTTYPLITLGSIGTFRTYQPSTIHLDPMSTVQPSTIHLDPMSTVQPSTLFLDPMSTVQPSTLFLDPYTTTAWDVGTIILFTTGAGDDDYTGGGSTIGVDDPWYNPNASSGSGVQALSTVSVGVIAAAVVVAAAIVAVAIVKTRCVFVRVCVCACVRVCVVRGKDTWLFECRKETWAC